ncbi:MAG: hypothetical protein WDO14_25305 [Bacteroidota bacterium]
MKKIGILLLFAAAIGCSNDADPEADKSFFTKFYDDSNFNVAYTPLDAVQTSSGGYLVLGLKRIIDSDGSSIDPGVIYIMRTDEFGAFVSDIELDETFVTPAPAFLDVNGHFYFFAMDSNGLSTQLFEVDENGQVAQQLNVGGSYPLAAGIDGTSLLLLNYDVGNKMTQMSVVSTDGHIQKSKEFTIGAGDGPEEPIMNHILRTGRLLPFQVGKTTGGLYFFNGFYNYTLSIVFTDLSADNPQGVIQGNQEDGGMSQVFPLSGGKFAAARFNYGDNYFLPQAALTQSGVTSCADLGGNPFPELSPNAPVTIITTSVGSTDRIIYGSNTRGKQIALFGYNPADGTFIGSKYIGFSNSFELASLTPTSDKGLLVLGTTYIAGRFPRICLFKLSAESLGDSFQQ